MAIGKRRPPRDRGPQIRVNHRIRVPEVRVVLGDGTMLGVMATQQALKEAESRGLDLVEVNPKALPPVCKILDFGRFKYLEKKRQSEAKRHQTVVELKEVKLRPKTDDHDLHVKLRAARRFLEARNKVKFTVRFRGREITHPERATMQLDWLIEHLEDLANVEQRPTMEGRTMSMIVAGKPHVIQKLQNARSQQAADGAAPAAGDMTDAEAEAIAADEGDVGEDEDEDEGEEGSGAGEEPKNADPTSPVNATGD